MKKSVVLFTIILSLFSVTARAVTIECAGQSEVIQFQMKAEWVPGQQLTSLQFVVDGQSSKMDEAPLQKYRPRHPLYQGFNRFEIGYSGWSTISILLPQTLPSDVSFTGFYYDHGHSGLGTVALACQILNASL